MKSDTMTKKSPTTSRDESTDQKAALRPVAALAQVRAYRTPKRWQPIDLRLDANEGPADRSIDAARQLAQIDPELLRRYPDASELERAIAESFNLEPARVLVTAGGDEAIDRLMRAMLEPGRSLIQVTPTFVMIDKAARRNGATVVDLPWADDGERFPVEEVLDAIDETTSVVSIVSPDNPTGTVVPFDMMQRVIERAARIGAVVLVDLAYVEFADSDPTRDLLAFENVLVVRTLSKAWGLAGLRVGYALGSMEMIGWLRAAAGPYPTSGVANAVAFHALTTQRDRMYESVKRIRSERDRLFDLMRSLGANPIPSKANFVAARFEDPARARWFGEALAGLGIGVRTFAGGSGLLGRIVRITCPGHEEQFARLARAVESVLRPRAILFDLDGVIADVRESYYRAIIETCRSYNADITIDDIAEGKRAGCANNEWVLTQRLLAKRGVHAALDEITERFQHLYAGDHGAPGFETLETMLIDRAILEALRARFALAIVTGRLRDEARRFIRRFDLESFFDAIVCMEDAPLKPDPAPVRRAIKQLRIEHAWMIGDTVDDLRAARAAGVVPVGIVPPGDSRAALETTMLNAGAAWVIDSIEELMERLP